MAHEKIKAAVLFLTIFSIVGTVSWAVAYAQQTSEPNATMPKLDIQRHIRDAALAYVVSEHPEATQVTGANGWIGGQVETGLLGAETYLYESQGWTVKIQYPVVPAPVYSITVQYALPAGGVGIPYSLVWEGTWQEGTITEASFVFAQ